MNLLSGNLLLFSLVLCNIHLHALKPTFLACLFDLKLCNTSHWCMCDNGGLPTEGVYQLYVVQYQLL